MAQLSCEIKAISARSWGLADWLGLSLAIILKGHMKIHYQGETCLKYLASKGELEHHLPGHKKEMCSKCKKVIRKDEMVFHKINHKKLKTFGKKLLKQKTVKPATGYGLWQSEERERIIESNPGMNFNNVS